MLMRLSSWRPQPAIIISCLALFVALGGTSYAAVKLAKNSVGTREIKTNGVSSAEIKAKAVTASEVKDDSLTGTDINESTLGQVPSAAAATSATTASNVGGTTISKINYSAPDLGADQEIYNSGGLKLVANCATSAVDVTASTSAENSMIKSVSGSGNTPYDGTAYDDDSSNYYREDDDFDVGETFSVLYDTSGILSGDSMTGSVAFSQADNTVITIQYLAEWKSNAFGGTNDCFFRANAVKS
ncbi:MAG: hypothetical protein JHC87_05425 [Thermoleophilaceae bacterium]|nr:hypothetical protein [Thermoleophilaceae bacterium]